MFMKASNQKQYNCSDLLEVKEEKENNKNYTLVKVETIHSGFVFTLNTDGRSRICYFSQNVH